MRYKYVLFAGLLSEHKDCYMALIDNHVPANYQELQQAFVIFSQASDQLSGAYQGLQQQVTQLTQELALANGELRRQVIAKEDLSRRLGLLMASLPGSVAAATLAVIDHVEQLDSAADLDETGIIAQDPSTVALLLLARRIAKSSATVMLTGESGSGKEVVARFIHRHSTRTKMPFVAINCAAIPENLLEATLFGYEKGAFTGAAQSQAGKFEQAQGGTLLLDEISEMPLGLQAKLLRVLQEREVERVGGRKAIALDIRVLATSNRDLRAMVDRGAFREDLYYRLNVFPLEIPPLRERPLDIVPLAQRILETATGEPGRGVPVLAEAAAAQLMCYAWPGNVRELENVIQRAMILAADVIEVAHLNLPETVFFGMRSGARDSTPPPSQDIKSLERSHIMETLAAVNGSRKLAVQRLGISERTLRYKLQQYRLASC